METETLEETDTRIEHIKQALSRLSDQSILVLHEHTAFLLDRERKHKAFVEETLKAAHSPDTITFTSADELIEAALNWRE